MTGAEQDFDRWLAEGLAAGWLATPFCGQHQHQPLPLPQGGGCVSLVRLLPP